MTRRKTADGGFTLIELVIAVVIMGIITVPLGNFMLSYLTTFQTTQDRISDSHDILISSAYFSQDVANTGVHQTTSPYGFQQSVWTAASPPAGAYCGQTAGAALVVSFSWDVYTPTTSGGSTTAVYTKASATYLSNGGLLQRVYCANGTTTTSSSTLVHGYQSGTITCDTTCTAATPPLKVTLALTISTGSTDKAKPSQPVTLNGQRRQT